MMDLFTETVDKISDSNQSMPPLVRRVIAIDTRRMIIAPTSNSKARIELWRGKTRLDGSEPPKAVIIKKLLADLESMHVSGFRRVDAGNGMLSWRLDSRAVRAAADSMKKK